MERQDHCRRTKTVASDNSWTGCRIKRAAHSSTTWRLFPSLVTVLSHTLILVCLWTSHLALAETNDIEEFLNELDKSVVKDATSNQGPTLWGIPDQNAVVGKIFSLSLSKPGNDGPLKVREVGKESLPSWLTYDETTSTLHGLPEHDSVGQQHFIEVIPSGQPDNKDVFSITVAEDRVHSETSAVPLKDAGPGDLRPIKCPPGSSVTMASIILDINLPELSLNKKLSMMKGMCSHLKIPQELLRIVPVGNKPLFDSSALVAGPGDVKDPKHPGAMMQWEVGCGNVFASHMPILQQLEMTSHDGSMAKAVGHGVVGWHVTNNKPHSPTRLKRRAYIKPTPTPEAGIGRPTKYPKATSTLGPDYRVVPSPTPSPSVPKHTRKTKTRTKSRSRTRTKTRHPHGKTRTRGPGHSPKHRSKTVATPMPTPTLQPIQPTRVVSAMPTLEGTGGPIRPPYEVGSSPGVSRTGGLEPSTPTRHPGHTGGPTEILPTKSIHFTDTMTTGPIHPTHTDGRPGPTDGGLPTDEIFNFPPTVKNDIDRIQVAVGDILNYKIPADTFSDRESGNTPNLKLVFMTVDGLAVDPKSWVKFNATTQTLYGLPMVQHEGTQEYTMSAIDANGKIARDVFEIVVVNRPYEFKINHEFSVTLDLEYQKFVVDVDQRIDVANKIAKVYGDSDMSKITVTKIAPGSVEYSWTNNSLPYDPCPTQEVIKLLRYLITENSTLNESFVESFKPYKILKAGAEPRGSCDETIVPSIKSSGQPPTEAGGDIDDEAGAVETHPRESSNEDVLITTVVPAVVIAAMLLLAGCIACILYRKKRKGKLSDEDQHTFVNKGIPVIFADELEDKPDTTTTPLIMDEEKPPQPPPDYHKSSSLASTPPSEHKQPFLDSATEDDEKDDLDQPYKPPPPMTGTAETRQARPRAQPPGPSPPRYVPP